MLPPVIYSNNTIIAYQNNILITFVRFEGLLGVPYMCWSARELRSQHQGWADDSTNLGPRRATSAQRFAGAGGRRRPLPVHPILLRCDGPVEAVALNYRRPVGWRATQPAAHVVRFARDDIGVRIDKYLCGTISTVKVVELII
jgi:hypothetical protein